MSVRTASVSVIHIPLKGLELAMDVLSHHVYGPRRKSWGIEMTIVNSLARDASSHSHLFDIVSESTVTVSSVQIQYHPLRNSCAV